MTDTLNINVLYNQYREAMKNNFFDPWGIVLNYETYQSIKAEGEVYCTVENGSTTETFCGLVLIPVNIVDNGLAYIVDESLGRQIRGNYD